MVSKLYVIGMGMGNPETLTLAAQRALASSELIIGAPRLLDALAAYDVPKLALVASDQIAHELHSSDASVASVVMSGDVGLHSGATKLYDHIEDLDLEVIPGISSLAYLCAKLRMPWQDVHVASAHGRFCDVAAIVRTHAKSFLLTGGKTGPEQVIEQLVAAGLGEVRVWVGERLSYPDERIVAGSARKLCGQGFANLTAMLVINDAPLTREFGGPSLPDSAFERGQVPMTKEEVRALAICKLRIRSTDVVWDIGSGTGSVSVEAARAACAGRVYAIDSKPEAQELTQRNAARFGLTNVTVVAGAAPQVLAGLPVPDRVFVGGSGGKLAEILEATVQANPCVRLCIPAIALETLTEALSCLQRFGLQNVDIAQVSVAKAREAGALHLMMGGNPIYLLTADGPGAPTNQVEEECACS